MGDFAVADFGYFGGAGEGDFVESSITVDDHGVLYVQEQHGFSDERDEAGLVDAHDLAAGSGGVEKGA